jgi:hypothetical protein
VVEQTTRRSRRPVPPTTRPRPLRRGPRTLASACDSVDWHGPVRVARPRGHRAGDVDALLQWARQRAQPSSPASSPARRWPNCSARPSSARPAQAAAMCPHPPDLAAQPRPIARSVSRPVPQRRGPGRAERQASRDIELALENAETAVEDAPLDPAPAPRRRPRARPPAEPEDEDPHRSAASTASPSPSGVGPSRPARPTSPTAAAGTLTRGFELHAEAQQPGAAAGTTSTSPSPPASRPASARAPACTVASLDAESSGGLVLGIPDEDGDIPCIAPPRSQPGHRRERDQFLGAHGRGIRRDDRALALAPPSPGPDTPGRTLESSSGTRDELGAPSVSLAPSARRHRLRPAREQHAPASRWRG